MNYYLMARRVLSVVAVAPVVDLVVVVAGKEHRKQMLEPPALDSDSRRQKWMQEQIWQEQVDRTKVDRTKVDRMLNLQSG